MATGRRIAPNLSVALLAAARVAVLAAAMLTFAAPARADCFSDIANAIANTTNAIGSPECQSALSESAEVVAVFTGALSADQNLANQICNAVGDVNKLQGLIPVSVTSVLDGLDPVDFAECACDLSQGIGQVPGEVLSCVQGLICGIQNDIGFGGCSCQPPPPDAANCTPPPGCANNSAPQSQCGNILLEDTGQSPQPVWSKQLTDGSWYVLDATDGWDGKSPSCTADRYCLCPAPLVVVKTPVSWNPGVYMIS